MDLNQSQNAARSLIDNDGCDCTFVECIIQQSTILKS